MQRPWATRGHRQTRGLVEHAVAIRILKQAHGADGRVGGILLVPLVMRFVGVRIVAHLADIGAAILVVGHRDRTRDERLGGEEVHVETIEHAKGLCGVAGGRGQGGGQSAADGVGRRRHARIRLGG